MAGFAKAVVWSWISFCGVVCSGVAAVAQKLFLTLFCAWLPLEDVLPDSEGQLVSIGCWSAMDENGKVAPLSQVLGNVFCVDCARAKEEERSSAAGNMTIRISM